MACSSCFHLVQKANAPVCPLPSTSMRLLLILGWQAAFRLKAMEHHPDRNPEDPGMVLAGGMLGATGLATCWLPDSFTSAQIMCWRLIHGKERS